MTRKIAVYNTVDMKYEYCDDVDSAANLLSELALEQYLFCMNVYNLDSLSMMVEIQEDGTEIFSSPINGEIIDNNKVKEFLHRRITESLNYKGSIPVTFLSNIEST